MKVIYVLGMPRAATTVSGDLLASIPEVVHLGPLVTLDSGRAVEEIGRIRCGCGHLLANCDFWAPLVPKVGSVSFDQLLDDIVQRCSHHIGSSHLVDSSKDFGRLWPYLRRDDSSLAGVVLAWRPPIKFLLSRYRHARSRKHGRRSRPRLAVAMLADAARWVGMGLGILLVRSVMRIRSVPTVLVSPKRVAGNPGQITAQFAEAFQLSAARQLSERVFETGPTHTVGGSPSRIRPDGLLRIHAPSPAGSSKAKAKEKTQ